VTGPYREPAPVEREAGAPLRYVPITRREERVRRVVRYVPVILFAAAAFLFDKPWLIGGAIAWGLGIVVVTRVHERALNERLKALAGTLARNGDPFVASRNLESLVADSRTYPGFHSVALLFLGIARARGGDADGALELLYVVQRGGWLAHRLVWMAWLLPWMATLHAARGEVDLAERWLDAARKVLPAAKQEALVAPQALVLLRKGQDDEAVTRIDAYMTGAEATDPVREHFALVRAFACERAGRPLPDDEVRRLVQARLASPGRALPLEKWWVEFAAYVERYAAS
jgi:hypothetical protein